MSKLESGRTIFTVTSIRGMYIAGVSEAVMYQNFSFSYHIILLLAWLAYVLLHSLLATNTIKLKMQQMMGRNYKYYRLCYSIFAALSLAAILIYQFNQASPLLFANFLGLNIFGTLLSLLGLVGMAICIRKYFLNLSGVDVLMKEKREPVLEIAGLHRFVRHPLYSSTLMFCWALFLLFPFADNLVACVVISVYTLFGIRLEERKLVEEFGENYTRYSRSTPMLIPGLF
ncbi:MAG: isoprenylcysteine carboxylmethyltransferase family protein [Chitinophagaceae bacterium]